MASELTTFEARAIPSDKDIEGDMPRRLAAGPMHLLVYVREDVVAELLREAAQQRAARAVQPGCVKVVEILQEPEDHNRSVDYPINIKAGQTLALIELAPTKAACGAVSMCMGCLGTGHMEGFGECPHCKGTGQCPHNKRAAEAAAAR